MVRYHFDVSFGASLDSILNNIEETEPSESYRLLRYLIHTTDSYPKAISALAMATAKWVDHAVPLLGHGIINADPTIRAIQFLKPKDRDLALLQIVMYVNDLLEHPNYGPYTMQKINGLGIETVDEIPSEFSKVVRSGNGRYRAEKILTNLYSASGKKIKDHILYEALMQFGGNEHRLLLPYHTLRLLERENNWDYAVTLLRPSVQYLSTNPDISHGVKAEQLAKQFSFRDILNRGNGFDENNAFDITRMLLNSTPGNEMIVLSEYGKTSTLQDIYEAIALTSTILLMNSHLDPHSVTGKHCILSIMRDRTLSTRTRSMALLSSMESPYVRRIKSYLAKSLDIYMKTDEKVAELSEKELLDALESELNSGKKDNAFSIAGKYIRSGHSIDKIASLMLQTCFRTEGPFESLHTAKMLVGMRDITHYSKSSMKWLHLAAGASFVAERVKKDKKEASEVSEQFRKLREL